ncbi:N-acetylmuramoyl-L-alanine amidase [Agrobacterium phage Atu_ph04]|uniref:N-acetylmuramoyl-L-alanine amidase n=1 Tax=Agrobacterium phage Atu_ph04 TaxID=2024263 RepID=A0A223VZK2_9CAUD|nr:amidase [Agrobacterium phage Atu_ph04]ASV44592.1 N-acetylmuramoyl-L-alanine amidase [Agrobacterium phage Atu_ph04]
MTIKLKNGKLVSDVTNQVNQFKTTKKSSGVNQKRYVVVHYTAGENFDSDVRQLSSSPAKVSCHVVIGRNGQVAQIGSFDDIQWHAGVSQWDGINGLNSYSIGIELTNPGWLVCLDKHLPINERTKDGVRYQSASGRIYTQGLVFAKNPNVGSEIYGWVPYTTEQLTALREVIVALKQGFNSIREVVGHEQIAPKRKVDPGIGIIFPKKFLDQLNETTTDNTDDFYRGTDGKLYEYGFLDKTDRNLVAGKSGTVTTKGSALRIRDRPNAVAMVIGSYENGERVHIVDSEDGFYKTDKGYIASGYVKLDTPGFES